MNEAPNSKLQAPEKSQAPNLRPGTKKYGVRRLRLPGRRDSRPVNLRIWNLELLWSLELGAWSFLPVLLALLLMTGFGTLAQTTNTSTRSDYPSFKIITDRNIFNTRRSPRYVPSQTTGGPRTRSESFALVGTMKYEKGPFAFFDGSRSDYRKVLKQDEAIAGFKVTAIETSYVKLASPTNEIELHVGMQLRREDEGEWRLSARPESLEAPRVVFTPARPSSEPGTNRSTSETAPPPEGDIPAAVIEGVVSQFLQESGAALGNTDNRRQPAATGSPSTPNGNEGDVLERLRRRAAAERGESP